MRPPEPEAGEVQAGSAVTQGVPQADGAVAEGHGTVRRSEADAISPDDSRACSSLEWSISIVKELR